MSRGAKKGERRGGRLPGTPNRRTKQLVELMEQMFPGYNPVIQLAEIAQDETVDISYRVTCAKELANYLYPKRKAVDLSGKEERVTVVIAGKDLLL